MCHPNHPFENKRKQGNHLRRLLESPRGDTLAQTRVEVKDFVVGVHVEGQAARVFC